MQFGEKQEFAIEVLGEKPLTYLPVRIWLSGVPIGTLDDETYIPTFANRILRVTEPPRELFADVASAESRGMAYVLSNECEDNGRYFVGLGDTFDDFTLLRYPINEDIVFLWKLTESSCFSYIDVVPGKECKCVVPQKVARNVVSSFLRVFNQQ